MDRAEFRMSRLVPVGLAMVVAISALAGCSSSSAQTATVPVTPVATKPTTTAHRPVAASSRKGASAAAPGKDKRAASSTSTPGSSSTSTTAPAGFGNVDRASATAVAKAMLVTTFTSNTTKDETPQAAVARSEIWYTPAGAAAVRSGLATGPVGAQWIEWTAHKVVTTVAVTVASDTDAPPDTATTAARQLTVTVTPHGASGWTSAPDYYICFVRLVRSGSGPWQVSSLETDPYTPDLPTSTSAPATSSAATTTRVGGGDVVIP
jgi:hypothetical protein